MIKRIIIILLCAIGFMYILPAALFVLGDYLTYGPRPKVDISDQPEPKEIVNKTYELVKDVYLYKFINSNEYRMGDTLVCTVFRGPNNEEISTTEGGYSELLTIPKGVRFEVIKVAARKGIFGKLTTRYVYGRLLSDKYDRDRVNVDGFFWEEYDASNINWHYEINHYLIREVPPCEIPPDVPPNPTL